MHYQVSFARIFRDDFFGKYFLEMLPAAILLSPCLFSGAIVTHTTSVHTTIVQVSFAKVASCLRDAGSTDVSALVWD